MKLRRKFRKKDKAFIKSYKFKDLSCDIIIANIFPMVHSMQQEDENYIFRRFYPVKVIWNRKLIKRKNQSYYNNVNLQFRVNNNKSKMNLGTADSAETIRINGLINIPFQPPSYHYFKQLWEMKIGDPFDIQMMRNILTVSKNVFNKTTLVPIPKITLLSNNQQVIIIGDLHGSLDDLKNIFIRNLDTTLLDLRNRYIFLGDFIDKGPQNVAVALLIILLKLHNPYKVFICRGNHEDSFIGSSTNISKIFKKNSLSRELILNFLKQWYKIDLFPNRNQSGVEIQYKNQIHTLLDNRGVGDILDLFKDTFKSLAYGYTLFYRYSWNFGVNIGHKKILCIHGGIAFGQLMTEAQTQMIPITPPQPKGERAKRVSRIPIKLKPVKILRTYSKYVYNQEFITSNNNLTRSLLNTDVDLHYINNFIPWKQINQKKTKQSKSTGEYRYFKDVALQRGIQKQQQMDLSSPTTRLRLPNIEILEKMAREKRSIDRDILTNGLLWSDFSDNNGINISQARYSSKEFVFPTTKRVNIQTKEEVFITTKRVKKTSGPNITSSFLDKNGLDYIIKGHQPTLGFYYRPDKRKLKIPKVNFLSFRILEKHNNRVIMIHSNSKFFPQKRITLEKDPTIEERRKIKIRLKGIYPTTKQPVQIVEKHAAHISFGGIYLNFNTWTEKLTEKDYKQNIWSISLIDGNQSGWLSPKLLNPPIAMPVINSPGYPIVIQNPFINNHGNDNKFSSLQSYNNNNNNNNSEIKILTPVTGTIQEIKEEGFTFAEGTSNSEFIQSGTRIGIYISFGDKSLFSPISGKLTWRIFNGEIEPIIVQTQTMQGLVVKDLKKKGYLEYSINSDAGYKIMLRIYVGFSDFITNEITIPSNILNNQGKESLITQNDSLGKIIIRPRNSYCRIWIPFSSELVKEKISLGQRVFAQNLDVLFHIQNPFKSEKQRRYMWLRHPRIAQRWETESKRKR